jgi:2-phosphosulfolactate phosphatase
MTVQTVDRLEDLPAPAPDADFVVVDVIISSTTIVRLLEEGASYVRPFADPERAREFKTETEDALLVGEDGGGPIPGFDLSPLPSVIAEADIEGRPVGIRTSNGTRAMERIGHGKEIYVGTTINAGAVAGTLRERDREAWVVAAGRRGEPTPEDSAGARLIDGQYRGELTDSEREKLARDVSESSTAKWLRDIGYDHELDELLAFDSTTTVPKLEDGVFVGV